MRFKLLGIGLLIAGLFLGGCTGNNLTATETSPAPAVSQEPSPHVQGLIDKFHLSTVDYTYVKEAVGNGTRGGAKALLIDARPHPKYLAGTIPSSINIPDTKIDQYIGQLDKVAKDRKIIVFCGGWKCEKSPIVAGHLKGMGYTNIKLYQAGEPDWANKNYLEIGTPVIQGAYKKNSAVLIDARPRVKFLAESIPGAMNMNDTDMDKLAGRLPIDKNTPIITFCAGYECHKSHADAIKLLELGYTNVRVYAAGLPGWKAAGLPTTAGVKKTVLDSTPKKDVFVDGIKVGVDEGTVDGEWFKALLTANKVPKNVVLIDVRDPTEYAGGHLKGAINIQADKLSPAAIAAKLPKGKVAIFNCGTGARALEAYLKLKDAKIDVKKVMYFDANIKCDKKNTCDIKVNEPLG